ncbi:MAG: hypothetical protein H6654_01185 [Ardenticatenaceae bacterium]|nr:hypothetical protein [Anaerolineales bacterium]MCB8940796.1 hypothetical protein [Ardenticatenaceae bacterium]MCB8972135.1 hypothetical protein [Ardenticatenaceae bacterium]
MKRIIVAGLFTSFIALVGVSSVFAAPPAYIDPNTGGMLAQALIVVLGMLTGVWFFFANRIKMYFNRMMRDRRGNNEPVVQEVVTPETPQENNVQ